MNCESWDAILATCVLVCSTMLLQSFDVGWHAMRNVKAPFKLWNGFDFSGNGVKCLFALNGVDIHRKLLLTNRSFRSWRLELIAVSISGHSVDDGSVIEMPKWKISEALLYRINLFTCFDFGCSKRPGLRSSRCQRTSNEYPVLPTVICSSIFRLYRFCHPSHTHTHTHSRWGISCSNFVSENRAHAASITKKP